MAGGNGSTPGSGLYLRRFASIYCATAEFHLALCVPSQVDSTMLETHYQNEGKDAKFSTTDLSFNADMVCS